MSRIELEVIYHRLNPKGKTYSIEEEPDQGIKIKGNGRSAQDISKDGICKTNSVHNMAFYDNDGQDGLAFILQI